MVKKRKGFTLIEVVTALFIIGLLTMLILPNIHRVRDIANRRQAETMERTIQSQADLYLLEHPEDRPVTKGKLLKDNYLSNQQSARMEQLGLDFAHEGNVKRHKNGK